MPIKALIEQFGSLWDRITSVSDKAAIKVLVAMIIGWLLFKDSGQKDEKDNSILTYRSLWEQERLDHRSTKLELLDCRGENNNIWKDVAIGKDTIIANLSKPKK